MDILGWLWWIVTSLIGFVWTVVWFLIGGWVSTLAQIGVVVLLVFGYKYGWMKGPTEIARRLSTLSRYGNGWLRARDGGTGAPRAATASSNRRITGRPARRLRVANLSTVLNCALIAGPILLALAMRVPVVK